jgi:hypothetical protein
LGSKINLQNGCILGDLLGNWDMLNDQFTFLKSCGLPRQHILKEPMCIVDAKGENVLIAFNNFGLLHLGGITMSIKETWEQWFVPL